MLPLGIEQKIYKVRGTYVMLDSDLAELYDVPTKVFNQAVSRNVKRFPEEFRFQITEKEYGALRSQFVTLERGRGKHRKYLPYVFTEQGVAMLSAILRSDTAISVSIAVMNAFVNMRAVLAEQNLLADRVFSLETKQVNNEESFERIFQALESGAPNMKQGIFYDGEVFDAAIFVSDLVRSAKKSIVLIDNYVDDETLAILSKKRDAVSVSVYTKKISHTLKSDIKKFQKQYGTLSFRIFEDSHDRFLIIDHERVYHFGASLKDLGKKWFAFSLMELPASEIIAKLKKG